MRVDYPLRDFNDRPLSPRYRGPAMVWDIDKTYLSTRFSSVKGLARIPVEFAVDKRAIPGMPEILRGLRRGPGLQVACVPLYFISASPAFLRSVIERKMLLDGVEQDGIIFKDWLRSLWQGRPGRLWEQLGFKIHALLLGRAARLGATEYLFGDDAEQDAEAYSLYARWLHGEISPAGLEAGMAKLGVSADDHRGALRLAQSFPAKRGRVGRIFIHLERGSLPRDFSKYGKLLVSVRGAYQLALALFGEGLIDARVLREVQGAVQNLPNYRFGDLAALSDDARKRGLLPAAKWRELRLKFL
jgi:Uncharacterized conserved protein